MIAAIVGGCAVLWVLWVLAGLLSFLLLRELVHTPSEGRVAGIAMAVVPAIIVTLVAVRQRRSGRRRRPTVAEGGLLAVAFSLWLGGLALHGGKRVRAARVAWMESVLPGFRGAFIVSMGVLLVLGGTVGWWRRRRTD